VLTVLPGPAVGPSSAWGPVMGPGPWTSWQTSWLVLGGSLVAGSVLVRVPVWDPAQDVLTGLRPGCQFPGRMIGNYQVKSDQDGPSDRRK
jgi:hypothetical protein